MRELIDSGDLPHIRKEILAHGTFRIASSCCPSTTGPAHLPFFTGCFPGRMNIPGIRWLDKAEFRRSRLSLSRFRSYNGIEAPLINHDLPKGRPTLFEMFDRPFSVFSIISRGLPRGHNRGGFTKPIRYLYAHLTGRWDSVDAAAHRNLLRCVEEDPDFVFTLLPGVDCYSHLFHPRHEKTIAAYRFADYTVGKLVEKLKTLGLWDNTLLLVTSDHGLTVTHKHLDLALFFQKRGVKTMYYPVIWKSNPQASVMISGNALAHVYWLDRKSEEMLSGDDVKEALGPTWDELLSREEIDFIAWRSGQDLYEIESAGGRASIIRQGGGLSYLPEVGDPLGLGRLQRPMDEQEALVVTFNSNYPDALVQLEQLLRCPRSGDFLVMSKKGYDLRQAFEWPEHHSSHGSLHREHMLVPLIYNQIGWDARPARTADIFNTILKWSGRATLEDTDGHPLC